MNVTLANTINFVEDSLNLAKEAAVNYGGRAITQLKHLPVTMHEDFRVAYGVTATVTAVALVAGECFGEYIWKKVDGNDRKPASEVVKRLVFTATLASAYVGLSYAAGFPQSKTVSALIVTSFIAIRCLYSALDWQKVSICLLKGQDILKEEKTIVEQERDTLRANLANIESTNLQGQINALQQENLRLSQELAKSTPLPEENKDNLLDDISQKTELKKQSQKLIPSISKSIPTQSKIVATLIPKNIS